MRKKILYFITVFTLLFSFTFNSYADSDDVPISVEWYSGSEKWNDSQHNTTIQILDIQNNTKNDYTNRGDFSIDFKHPEFKTPGNYEYKVYLTSRSDKYTYDETIYKLIFEVKPDLSYITYAYEENNQNEKVQRIIFKNNDYKKGEKQQSIKENNSKSSNSRVKTGVEAMTYPILGLVISLILLIILSKKRRAA